jgi:hypothetical protein
MKRSAFPPGPGRWPWPKLVLGNVVKRASPGVRSMSAVFINYVHPDTPHVSAMRVRYFADAMTRRGHRIILLTPTLNGQPNTVQANEVSRVVEDHDWSRTLHLSCASRGLPFDLRAGALAHPLRRVLTMLSLIAGGGPQADWVRGSSPYLRALAEAFCPEITWATFGNISSLVLAQTLSRLSGSPWVMDMKDNWAVFVPPILRAPVAFRFADAAGFTANSDHHSAVAKRWHKQRNAVVHSGVAQDMIANKESVADPSTFRVTLVGSIYDKAILSTFVAHFGCWVAELSPTEREVVEFCYVGGAAHDVRIIVQAADLPCRLDIRGPIDLQELGVLCQSSAVNCYLWASFGFHHKLLELIACRRPLISFPGEHSESIALASEFGGELFPCADAQQLKSAFSSVWENWSSPPQDEPPEVACDRLTWDAMAVDLERFLFEIVDDHLRKK